VATGVEDDSVLRAEDSQEVGERVFESLSDRDRVHQSVLQAGMVVAGAQHCRVLRADDRQGVGQEGFERFGSCRRSYVATQEEDQVGASDDGMFGTELQDAVRQESFENRGGCRGMSCHSQDRARWLRAVWVKGCSAPRFCGCAQSVTMEWTRSNPIP
jgi:hypothetical protein